MEIQDITREDFDKLPGRSRMRNDVFWIKIESLEVDYGVKIWRKDWTRKTDPIALIHQVYRSARNKKKTFACKTLPNNEGWLILRIT